MVLFKDKDILRAPFSDVNFVFEPQTGALFQDGVKVESWWTYTADIQPTEKQPPPPPRCEVCAKDFSSKRCLKDHVSAQHSEKKFQCEYCRLEHSYRMQRKRCKDLKMKSQM